MRANQLMEAIKLLSGKSDVELTMDDDIKIGIAQDGSLYIGKKKKVLWELEICEENETPSCG